MTPYEELEKLYAGLPTVQCKRMCQAYCGPILIPKIEAQRLEEKRGYLETESIFKGAKRVSLPAPDIIEREFVPLHTEPTRFKLLTEEILGPGHCVFLDPLLGSCMAYKIRPAVCRIWGCMDTPLMRCPYGCVPTRWITDAECKDLYEKIIVIQKGGVP